MTTTARHLYTTITDQRGTRAVRHTWQAGTDDLGEVMPTVLGDFADGYDQHKTIADSDGNTVAVILTAGAFEEGVTAQRALNDLAERGSPQESNRYRPFLHSPAADADRLLPIDDAQKTLARVLDVELDTVDKETRMKILGAAIEVVLHTALDVDASGQVPVMALVPAGDGGLEFRWSLAKRTPVPGLFKKPGAGAFSDDCSLITGSGWHVAEFWDETKADLAAENLAALLPGADWMVLGPDLTTEIKEAGIRAITAARKGERLTAHTAETATTSTTKD